MDDETDDYIHKFIRNTLIIKTFTPKIQEFIGKKYKYNDLTDMSIFCERFIDTKKNFGPNCNGLTTLACKIDGLNYAFCYWEDDILKFMCYGYPYESRDGEYRNFFRTWEKFQQIYEESKDILSGIELIVLEILSSDEYITETHIYANDDCDYDKIVNEVKDKRLEVMCLSYALLFFSLQTFSYKIENHASKKYFKILNKITDKYPILREYSYAYIMETEFNVSRCAAGQKYVPISYLSSISSSSIDYSCWREIYIGRIINNLNVNFICNNIPIFIGWTYICNIGKLAFENGELRDLYKDSDSAIEAIKKIDKSSEDLERERILLEQQIMTDIVGLIVFESKGFTLESIVRYMIYHPTWNRDYFTNAKINMEYVFCLMYNLHCLNERLDIIHGDIHSNNITFERDDYLDKIENSKRYIMIILDNNYDLCFAYNRFRYVPYIIDFSRSILGYNHKATIEVENGLAHTMLFYENQRERITKLLSQFYDIDDSNSAKYNIALRDNFETLFSILKLTDFISLIRSFRVIMTFKPDESTRLGTAYQPVGDMTNELNAIEEYVYEVFNSSMQKLLSNVKTLKIMPIFPQIAQKFFQRLHISNVPEEADLWGINVFSNKIIYEANEQETYPPYAKIEEFVKFTSFGVDNLYFNRLDRMVQHTQFDIQLNDWMENNEIDNPKIE